MKSHLWYRKRESRYRELLATWCGRDIGRGRVLATTRGVTCKTCLESFAALLRQLPDVDAPQPEVK